MTQRTTDAATIPYYRHLGFTVSEWDEERVIIGAQRRKEISNSHHGVHGGAISSLVDACLSQAIKARLNPGDQVVTISLAIQFVSPGNSDLRGIGRVTKLARTTAFGEATVYDDQESVVAHGLGTFKIWRSSP